MAQKTALSVQSLACHGKCSLTEALPIISAQGISLSVLPTVLLSTHTGGFGIPERLSTVEFFENTLNHFKNQKIRFDGIETGYFAEINQINSILSHLDDLEKEDTFLLVDPVLGDNGKLFSGITEDFVGAMLSLCQRADVITPNVTEACLLADEAYIETPGQQDIIRLSLKLYNITKAKVIITGIELDKKIATAVFDGEKIRFIYSKKLEGSFHGTGDMFSALVFSLVLKGASINKAVKRTAVFIKKSITHTLKENFSERDGLKFETRLKKI